MEQSVSVTSHGIRDVHLIWDGEKRHQPALTLSPVSYKHASWWMLCRSMIRQKKGYPFEVIISDDPHQTSVVLADHVKNLD